MGFEGTGNPEKHALPSGVGLFDVEERRRAEVGPSLARTRPTLAPLVGDLERWELAELGATGTRGES